MFKKRQILVAFILVSIVYVFSSLLQLKELEMFVKPLCLPILFYYYLRRVKYNFDHLTVISFIAFYIAEMLILFNSEKYYLQSISVYLIPYFVILYHSIKELFQVFRKKAFKPSIFLMLFVLVFFIFLFIGVVLTISIDTFFESLIIYTYGVSLILLGTLSVLLYVLRNSKTNLFLVMMVMAFILSDLYFILIKKIDVNWVFQFVNLVAQFFSFYFFVIYSILKTKKI